jgi:aspartate 4-decarboxylase
MEPQNRIDAGPFGQLSPFQLKDQLLEWARDFTQNKAATHELLNAGRGNPNWVATTPREAFFVLGQFALQECRRVWNLGHLGGCRTDGIADRLRAHVEQMQGDGAVTFAISNVVLTVMSYVFALLG